MKIGQMGTETVHAKRQDMTTLDVAIHNFAEAPTVCLALSHTLVFWVMA